MRTVVQTFPAVPKLAVILVGNNPASQIYVKIKKKNMEKMGMHCTVHTLPATTTQEELQKLIRTLNADAETTGILLQLPLPHGLNPYPALEAIDPLKDVDGLGPTNTTLLANGLEGGLTPATPLGIMRILEWQKVNLVGLNAVVVGRSHLVGMPTALLLSKAGATVTICHHLTKNVATHTKQADLIISATGAAHLIQPEFLKEEAMVIDVGVIRTKEGKIVGDVSPNCVKKAKFVTAVPGGVGPMTVASLTTNVVDSYCRQKGLPLPQWQIA